MEMVYDQTYKPIELEKGQIFYCDHEYKCDVLKLEDIKMPRPARCKVGLKQSQVVAWMSIISMIIALTLDLVYHSYFGMWGWWISDAWVYFNPAGIFWIMGFVLMGYAITKNKGVKKLLSRKITISCPFSF